MAMTRREQFRENALMEVQPLRTEETIPRSLRFAQYPDGSKRLQGAFFWTKGFQEGLVWRDIPLVPVDERGVAVDD